MRNDGTGSTLYAWDYRNRLADVTFKDGSGAVTGTIQYAYDGNNNRISQTVKDASGTVTLQEFYVYDGSNLLLVLDGSGNVKNRYFNGPNENQVLAEETNIVSSGAGDTHWALTDYEGTVRDVIDNSGSVLDHIQYDSFGNILSQSNSADAMRLAYTGQQYDTQTGLYYDHARYYDPMTGRFLSTDPAGFTAGDENLYRYVGNSPLNSTDPTGLCADSSTGQGDDSGPMTWDRAMQIARQAQADLNIANGSTNADDFRTRRDELISDGLSPDQADAAIAPLVAEASAMANQQMEDTRYATGYLTAGESLQGSGSIIANALSFGKTDQWGWTNSNLYQGDAFDEARLSVGASQTAMIMLTAEFTGPIGMVANYGMRGILAYQSGEQIGNGAYDLYQGDSAQGAAELAQGGFGLIASGSTYGMRAYLANQAGHQIGNGLYDVSQGQFALGGTELATGGLDLFTSTYGIAGEGSAPGVLNEGADKVDYDALMARGVTVASPTGSARVADLLNDGDLSYFPPNHLAPIGPQALTDAEMAELSGRIGYRQGLEDGGVEIAQMYDGNQYYLVKGEQIPSGWRTQVPQDPGWTIESHVHPNWSGPSPRDFRDLVIRNQPTSRIVHPNGDSLSYSMP